MIYTAVGLVWIALFAAAFLLKGLWAWSIGLAYIGYDTALLLFVGWQTLPLLRGAPAPAPESARPSLGVIIAAHNEAAVLPQTLRALFEQDDPPDQVVIADDGSTDALGPALAQHFGLVAPEVGQISAPSPLQAGLAWLRLGHGGKARALNEAIQRIHTDIVLTVDADTVLQPGALAAMRQAFAAEPRLAAATGVLTPYCSKTLQGRLFEGFQTFEYLRNYISRFAWMQSESLLLVSGAFAGFRRAAVLEVGGFDPQCLVEDYELIHRLHRFSVDHARGWTVRVVAGARAFTDVPGSLFSFLRQRRRWFAGFLQTQYWNRDMTGDRRYGRLGLLMLPIKAVDTLQPIYGLAAFGLLLGFACVGSLPLAGSIVTVMGGKIVFDLSFQLWSIHLYRRWQGPSARIKIRTAIAVIMAEPFSFQLLRHAGAAWGWIAFLGGSQTWGAASRATAGSIEQTEPT
jgi:cellulose synthase/poly-beta-1,6-N-acetylglucosamine synthase-like glycosyltransferase